MPATPASCFFFPAWLSHPVIRDDVFFFYFLLRTHAYTFSERVHLLFFLRSRPRPNRVCIIIIMRQIRYMMIERTNILPCKLYIYARKYIYDDVSSSDRSAYMLMNQSTICFLDGQQYEQCASAVIDMGDDSVIHNHAHSRYAASIDRHLISQLVKPPHFQPHGYQLAVLQHLASQGSDHDGEG